MMNIATETITQDPVSTEIFKAYGEVYVFQPLTKFVMAMNDTPVVPDRSFSFERRLIKLKIGRSNSIETTNQ